MSAAPSSEVRLPGDIASRLKPRGQQYLIRLLKPAEKSSGGVWLPQNYQENWTHGEVLKAGPGMRIESGDGGFLTQMWADAGDDVLFQKHAYKSLGPPHNLGLVKDEELVGKIQPGRMEITPLNAWVKVQQDPDIRKASSLIVYSEIDRPKPCRGTLVDYGPGPLRHKGPLRGIHFPIPVLWGLMDGASADIYFAEDWQEHLLGKKVRWSSTCEMLSLGREHLECLLIGADDILTMEDE